MATYYVDSTSGNDSNAGTFAAPWASWSKANAGRVTSDVVLFKCGTTYTNTTLSPSWGGVDGNHGVVGAYYSDAGVATRGVSGAKPIFNGGGDPFYGYWIANGTPSTDQKVVKTRDNTTGHLYKVTSNPAGTFSATQGSWTTTTGATFTNGTVTLQCLGTIANFINYNGLFNKPAGKNYFTYENLKGANYWGRGFSFDDSTASGTKIYSQSCDLDAIGSEAWVALRTLTYCTADNSQGTGATWNKCGLRAVGAAFNPNAGGSNAWLNTGFSDSTSAVTNYHTIDGLTVTKCAREGVLHHSYNTIKNCLIWNCYTGVYLTGGSNNYAYNNLILGGPDSQFHYTASGGVCGGAINISGEGGGAGLGGNRINSDYQQVYNNLVAFMNVGIDLGDTEVITGGLTYYAGRYSDIVHNTIVDCNNSVRNWQNKTYTGTRLQNNIFARYTAGTMLFGFQGTIPTKGYNLWPETPPANLSGTGDVISSAPGLTKTSGWRSLTSSSAVTAVDFTPVSSSPAIGAGTYIAAFATDYYGLSRATRTDMGAIQLPQTTAQVSDTFTAANGTAIAGRSPSPTNTPGNTWVAANTSTSAPTGSGTIQSNALQFANDNDGAVYDAGVGKTDVTFEVDWITVVSLNNRASVLIRHASNGNCIQWNVRVPNGDMNVYVREAGAITSTPIAGQAYSWTAGSTYALKVVTNGNTVTGFVNGAQVWSLTIATHNTATRFGVQRNGSDTGQTFDNVRISFDTGVPADVEAPSTPGTITASSVTTTSFDTNWADCTDNIGVVGYEAWYKLTSDSTYILRGTTASSDYFFNNLASGTSYDVKVRAYDLAGNYSAYSPVLTQATNSPVDATVPTFSSASSASADANNNITLSWTQATDNISSQANIVYRIFHSTTSGTFDFSNPIQLNVLRGVASVDLSGFKPGVNYFVVRAEDESGNRETNTTQVSVTLPYLGEYSGRARGRFR